MDFKRLIIGIQTLICCLACSVHETDFQKSADESVFFARIEQPSDPETKVYASTDLKVLWEEGDEVSIFNLKDANDEYRFTGKTGDNGGSFELVQDFSEEGASIDHRYAVYPYYDATAIYTKGVLSVDLHDIQHYREHSFGPGDNMMVAVTDSKEFQFKNACGYLLLKLYGEGVSVSSITLKGNNEEGLSGMASITMPIGGVPQLEMSEDANTEIQLICETPVQLGATEEESTQFWFVVPPVTFSKGFTISVTKAKGEVFEKSTSKNISVLRNSLSKMSSIEIEMISPKVPVPEAVDLGLSVKWASFNLGASNPEEYGDYYAWGETEPYYMPGYSQSVNPVWMDGKTAGYSLESYKWCKGTQYSLTKYCHNADYGYNGFTDDKSVLDSEDDAAHMNLGGEWRMPTLAEVRELIDNCTSELTKQGGVNGHKVTGPNGNSIFLPASGERTRTYFFDLDYSGYYWSSSLETSNPSSNMACYLNFEKSNFGLGGTGRTAGFSIRPVFGAPTIATIPVESVSLNNNQLTLFVGVNTYLEAHVLPSNATNQRVSWSSSDVSIATVTNSGVVVGVAPGSVVITATTIDGGKMATCLVNVMATSPYTIVPPEAIDLGLPSGLKWASFNLGATKPEEYGGYFAWGETEPYFSSQDPLLWKNGKEGGYTWSSYKWCMGSEYTMTKYCQRSDRGYNGFTDDKTVLDPEDDAAHVNLGGKWRMPTIDEFSELQSNCSWEWTSNNGIHGHRITGPNGNSIFLPTAGVYGGTNLNSALAWGYYWSSSLDTECPQYALYTSINSNYSSNVHRSYTYRFRGYSIRPVYSE